MAQNRFANFVNVSAGRKVHDRVGAEVHGSVQLLEFLVDVRGHRRVANVGIDLAQRSHADTHRLKFGMIDVRGNDHASAGDFVANQFGRKLFPVGNVFHLLGDHPVPGVVHLGEVAVGVLSPAVCDPLRPRPRDAASIAGSAVCGGHHLSILVKYLSKIIRRVARHYPDNGITISALVRPIMRP